MDVMRGIGDESDSPRVSRVGRPQLSTETAQDIQWKNKPSTA